MKRMSSFPAAALFVSLLLVPSACGDGSPTQGGPGASSAAEIPAETFVASAPSGAVEVREAIGSAVEGADVVVRAVIGGREKAFVDGRAILIAIDAGLESCTLEEGCTTPWDYCCQTSETLLANMMTVQIVGPDGAPLAGSLKGVHGLRELGEIVIQGTVRSAEGSLVVDAKRIHVVGG